MRKKLVKDKSSLGTLLTDELHSDFGSSARTLFSTNEDTGHYFFRSGMTINTAPGGAGTALEEGVDFLLNNELESFSDEVCVALDVPIGSVQIYRTVQITNVTYQSGALYYTYYGHGDSVQASVQNRNTVWTLAKDAAYTIDDAVYGDVTVLATAGAGGWTLKTPDATLNKHAIIEVQKVDTDAGVISIANDFAQTYRGASTLPLYVQGDSAKLQSDGANWIVLNYKSSPSLTTGELNPANTNVTEIATFVALPPGSILDAIIRITAATAGRQVLLWQDSGGTIPQVGAMPSTSSIPGLTLINASTSSQLIMTKIKLDAAGKLWYSVSNADVSILEIKAIECRM